MWKLLIRAHFISSPTQNEQELKHLRLSLGESYTHNPQWTLADIFSFSLNKDGREQRPMTPWANKENSLKELAIFPRYRLLKQGPWDYGIEGKDNSIPLTFFSLELCCHITVQSGHQRKESEKHLLGLAWPQLSFQAFWLMIMSKQLLYSWSSWLKILFVFSGGYVLFKYSP